MLWVAYSVVVVPLVLVALAAAWVPRWWQVVLLLSGPLVTVLALLGVGGLDRLGWLAVIGIPYAYLVVTPVLPWRKAWARIAAPVTVLLACGVLVGLMEGEPVGFVLVALPVTLALGALLIGVVARWGDRRAAARTL